MGVIWRLQAADDERLASGLDDFLGDCAQVVDLHDAPGLSEQSLDEAEVAAGDAGDGRDGFGVGEVVGGQGEPSLDQWCCRTKSSSSADSVRYSWTKPILL